MDTLLNDIKTVTAVDDVAVSRLGDKVIGVYFIFQKKQKAIRTYSIPENPLLHLNIDVDADDIPVGVEFVDCNSIPIERDVCDSFYPIEIAVKKLFAFCSQLAVLIAIEYDCKGDVMAKFDSARRGAISTIRGIFS